MEKTNNYKIRNLNQCYRRKGYEGCSISTLRPQALHPTPIKLNN